METIKVNMNPNPLDVQTIHASQNDGEARQWEFELHNNGELIDTSEITEQLFFKAYKGGTEQILPENTSTPTTSPFKGDIKYPQGLLSDQEFTYRQSPTEEDGLAKITDIKGNTLNWNQLASVLPRTQEYDYGLTFTNNEDGSITINGTSTNTAVRHPSVISGNSGIEWLTTHIYLINFANSTMTLAIRPASSYTFESGALTNGIGIFKPNSDIVGGLVIRINANSSMVFDNYRAYPQVFDLTKMLGEAKANELYAMEQAQIGSGVAYFRSLFPLSYYSYNQGSLLSFNGTGIKTVGKNLLPPSTEFSSVVDITINADNGIYTLNGRSLAYRQAIATNSFVLEPGTYRFSKKSNEINNNVVIQLRSLDGLTTYATASTEHGEAFTINDRTEIKFRITVNANAGVLNNFIIRPLLELGSTATSFEPYTSSTLSLPISTYFPTGMKSAGSVYDELTESKAITRVGTRAYQSGDESDTSVITDGTTTYYALATPTETSFTTASLVTENAEIPLSAENDVLIGKCTEELSAEPGFHDAKIKLTDSDGTCYSNKIQLHVERSPQ